VALPFPEGPEPGPGGPGAPLVLDLECRTSKNARRGAPHPVTITADWSFESHHDLDAERVAAAFGGFTSCVGVAERGVPALRELVRLLARRGTAPVSAVSARGWMVTTPVAGCLCERRFFRGPTDAARHARDVRHVARRHGADAGLLQAMLDAAVSAHDGFAPPEDSLRRAAPLVREDGGAAILWSAGIHADLLPELAGLVPGCEEALPTAYYLGVATRGVDARWLARTLSRRPDPDVATWLAWSAEAVAPTTGDDCGEWLGLGVPLRDVKELLEARTRPTTARELARVTGLSDRHAALYLANWAQAGCAPTAAHVALLERLGIARSYRPSVTAVNLLEATASDLPDPPSRTDLGVMLAIAGTRTAVLDLLERGLRTPHDALTAR
jgi:hypothetical protein